MSISVADEPRGGGVLRDALVVTFRRLMRLYFRDIERLGEPPGPDVRGRVFVANHTNGLIDPILVLTAAACEISPVAKATLWSVPVLRWLLDRAGAVPIVRRSDNPEKSTATNADVFERVADHLNRGGNILIFPEGTSHSEPHVAPLRSGAARMLLAADDNHGAPPTFQAVALEFDARTSFRSRCLLLWGPVRTLADVPDAADSDEARVQAITRLMAADLSDLLVVGETHEERLRVARVAELLANNAGDASLGAWNGLGRQVELAHRTLRMLDTALVGKVIERVEAYYAELERLGVADRQVVAGRPADPPARRPLWKRAALTPLAAAGVALYAVPYWVPRLIARRAEPDRISTVKLTTSLVVYPLWAAGLVTASLVLLPPPWSMLGAAVAIASPFAALDWLDRWNQRKHEPTPGERLRLAELRAAACAAIDEARGRLPS